MINLGVWLVNAWFRFPINLEECPIMSKLILNTFSWFGIWPCQPYTPNVRWLWYGIYHGGGTNHDFFSVGVHVIIVTTAIYHNDPQWTWVIAIVFQMAGGGQSIQSIGQCELFPAKQGPSWKVRQVYQCASYKPLKKFPDREFLSACACWYI